MYVTCTTLIPNQYYYITQNGRLTHYVMYVGLYGMHHIFRDDIGNLYNLPYVNYQYMYY